MIDLDGRVALVTGSSSGIGEATARALAAAGARVVVSSATSVEAGRAVAASLPEARYVRADIGDPAQARRLVDEAAGVWGRLDILVNNAGTTRVIPHGDLDAVTPEIFRRILEVNVLGTWEVTRAAMGHLRAAGDGNVINITSIAGIRPTGSSIPYAVSKAGLNHLTRLLANVVGPEVRVNAVAPGLIETPWTADWHDRHEAVRRRAPLARSGRPDDIARMVMGILATPYMTGEVIVVDGGLTLR